LLKCIYLTQCWNFYIHLNIIYICDASQINIFIFHIVLTIFTQLCMGSYKRIKCHLYLKCPLNMCFIGFFTIVQCVIIKLNQQSTRRNLIFFHPHTFRLLSNLTTFQLHLAILNSQAACSTNQWSILFIVITFTVLFTYEYNLDLIQLFNNFKLLMWKFR